MSALFGVGAPAPQFVYPARDKAAQASEPRPLTVRMRDIIGDRPGIGLASLAIALDCSDESARRAAQRLLDRGLVVRVGRGGLATARARR